MTPTAALTATISIRVRIRIRLVAPFGEAWLRGERDKGEEWWALFEQRPSGSLNGHVRIRRTATCHQYGRPRVIKMNGHVSF
jgi:hypothetical protein